MKKRQTIFMLAVTVFLIPLVINTTVLLYYAHNSRGVEGNLRGIILLPKWQRQTIFRLTVVMKYHSLPLALSLPLFFRDPKKYPAKVPNNAKDELLLEVS